MPDQLVGLHVGRKTLVLELAAVGPEDAEQQAYESGLSRAVGTEQTRDPFLQLEADIAQCENLAVLALDVFGDRDRRHLRGSLVEVMTLDSRR